jgi:hypothetical protein
MKPTKKKIKLGRYIVIIMVILMIYLFTKKISLDAKITIEQ